MAGKTGSGRKSSLTVEARAQMALDSVTMKNKDIALKHGISAARVSQIAVEDGWHGKTVAEHVRENAEMKTIIAQAKTIKDKATSGAAPKELAVSAELLEEASVAMAGTSGAHAEMLLEARQVHVMLMAELKALTGLSEEDRAALAELTALADSQEVQDPDAQRDMATRLAEIFKKFTGLKSRIESWDKLTSGAARLIPVERLVLGIDKPNSGSGGIEEMLRRVGGE